MLLLLQNGATLKLNRSCWWCKWCSYRSIFTANYLSTTIRKGDLIRAYLCSGGLIRGASRNTPPLNNNLYSNLDIYPKRCVLYKLLNLIGSAQESPIVSACVKRGSRRCVYKSFSLSRFKATSLLKF